jgi:long-subunit fatty acid transport protein
MTGAGAGYSLGIQVLPAPWIGLGLTYRSNLDVKVSGRDVLRTATGSTFDAEVKLPFPQSLTAGVFARVHKRVLLAGQIGWVDSSRFREIYLDVEGWSYGNEALRIPLRMRDCFQGHLGIEILAHRMLLLRAGAAYDSPAIPRRLTTRSLPDTHKMAWDLGFTILAGRWRFDLAAEAYLGDLKTGFQTRVVAAGTTAETRYLPGGTISIHLAGGVAW